jgi:flagellin
MTSINTNSAAMAALQTLQGVNNNLTKTQAQISSGLRVGSASDNAAYWSIATTMRSDNDANSAISDALGLGAATADTAYQGMNSAIDLVTQIQSKLVAAQAEGVDKSKVQGDISQLQNQLKTIVSSASFSGENWLEGDPSANTTKNVLGAFVRDSSGDVSVQTIDYTMDGSSVLIDSSGSSKPGGILDQTFNVSQDSLTVAVNNNGTTTNATVAAYSQDTLTSASATFDTNGDHANVATGNSDIAAGDYVKVQGDWVKAKDVGGTDQEVVAFDGTTSWGVDTSSSAAPSSSVAAPSSLLDMNISDMNSDDLGNMLKGVDKALTAMTSAAASLGSISARIDLQTDFVSKLSDSVTAGVGKLVDADMEEESSKLSALQTQQQLSIQSLSIANSSSQNILSLFRG